MSKPQQQPQAPFPNKYQMRQVASSDSKACVICYKPATTVMLAEGNGDFFYTCQQHLQDDQFANAIHPQEYTDLVSLQKELTSKKTQLEKDVELEKPYIWNKVAGYWKDDKKKKLEDGESKAEEAGSKYEKLKKELWDVTKELDEKTESILEFKFKQYKLNQDIYKNRLMAHQKKVYGQQRAAKIQQEGFFPSAPSHSLE
ncbi:hypothetical protein Cantr_06577 [Candida viswanathii]|uniref:VPS4-associated protein 1 n=1 Tax=Candida viswanathii TaxID=5486 RepID=A0A367XWE5_9ASCO|nr:hypothetical protein Cantr_06577 [Candida viswanathii]